MLHQQGRVWAKNEAEAIERIKRLHKEYSVSVLKVCNIQPHPNAIWYEYIVDLPERCDLCRHQCTKMCGYCEDGSKFDHVNE